MSFFKENRFILSDKKIPAPGYSVNKPETWLPYETAHNMAYVQRRQVSLVITKPYWVIDIDHCLENFGWSAIAEKLCKRFCETYREVSISGRGLHIIGIGEVKPGHKCNNAQHGFQFWTERRHVVLQPDKSIGLSGYDYTKEINLFVEEYLS